MLGTGAISIFGAATQFLIMTILGIPLALPLAVLAVFGGFIPYIGSLITTGLAFLVTVATGTPQDIAIMAIFTIVFNIVQGNFVAPIVYSRVVSLHPAVVLAAIPAGNQIAGIVGMFLVVPFLGVVAAVWRTVLRVLDTGPVEAAACRGSRGRGAGSRVVDRAQRLSGRTGPDLGRTAGRTRTRNGAGRTRRSESGPAPSRVDQMVRGQIPSALALAAENSSSERIPCAWSEASFSIWAVVGSSAGAAAGGGAYCCGGGAAASAAACCSAA